MKTFVKENWYKMMVGSSMLMASFGFMIYAISPAYSNSNSEKTEIINTNAPLGSNGVIIDGNVYFVSAGFLYSIEQTKIYAFIRNLKTEYRVVNGKTELCVPLPPIKKQLP